VWLESGEGRDVAVTLEIDNSLVPSPTSGSLALSGTMSITSGTEKLSVPWAYIKAARARVRHDSDGPTALFWSSAHGMTISSRRLDDGSIDTILPAGTYDLLLIDPTQPPGGVGLTMSNARIVMRESIPIDGQMSFDIPAAEARNTLRMGGKDEAGTLLAELPHMEDVFPKKGEDSRWYSTRYTIEYPEESAIDRFDILSLTSDSLPISNVSDRFRLFAGEYYSDVQERNKVYTQQYPPLQGVAGDVTFESIPYVSQEVEFVFPPSSFHRTFSFLHTVGVMRGGSSSVTGVTRSIAEPRGDTWRGTLYLTPQVDDHHTFSIFPNSIVEPDRGPGWGGPEMDGPMMRIVEGRIGLTSDQSPSPMAYIADPVETLRLGDGPICLTGRSYADDKQYNADLSILGPLLDKRVRAVRFTRFALYRDDTNEEVAFRDSVAFPGLMVPTDGPGIYRAEYLNTSSFPGGFPGTVLRTDWIDTSLEDRVPPTFHGLRILDSLAHSASRVPVGDAARLLFAVSDYSLDGAGRVTADTLDAAAVRVSYRVGALDAWKPLTLRQVAVDLGSSADLGHPPSGTIFEADLGPATKAKAEVHIRIETRDVAGNRSEQVFAPAFVVGDYQRLGPARRRGVGR
jgi:hypothetical protein